MAQKTFTAGSVLTASDINTYLMHEGGSWTTWTPTITQSGSVTFTNTRSTYARLGRTIIANFALTVTGSGTATNDIVVSLPATAAAANAGQGVGFILDTGNTYYVGTWVLTTTTTARLLTYGNGNPAGVNPNFALAVGDVLSGTITYEAAT